MTDPTDTGVPEGNAWQLHVDTVVQLLADVTAEGMDAADRVLSLDDAAEHMDRWHVAVVLYFAASAVQFMELDRGNIADIMRSIRERDPRTVAIPLQ